MNTLRIWFIFQEKNIQTCETFTIISSIFNNKNLFPQNNPGRKKTKKVELLQLKGEGREKNRERK